MPGCASASLATISATFFEGVLFLGARGLRVARSWLLDRPADRLQGFPATLRGELFQAQLIGHPACDLGARPKSAIGRRFAQTDTKPFQQLRLQNRRNATVVSSLISQRCGSERVVAFEQLFDPALPERSDISDLARRMPLRQQKNRLKMPQRRHVLAALATRLQLRNAQMVDDPSHVRLPRIMALPSIILIPPPESPLVESIARKPYHTSLFISQPTRMASKRVRPRAMVFGPAGLYPWPSYPSHPPSRPATQAKRARVFFGCGFFSFSVLP